MVWLPECIGLPSPDAPATRALVTSLCAAGVRAKRPDGGDMVTWSDDVSGAALVFNLDAAGKIVCVKPAMRLGSQFDGVVERFSSDPDGCSFCDPMVITQPFIGIRGQEVRPPHVFHLANAGMLRHQIAAGSELELTVTGFALLVRSWPDAAAFHAERGAAAHRDMLGFVFSPEQPSPSQYEVTGDVFSIERRRNAACDGAFCFIGLGVRLQGDAPIWMVARDADVPPSVRKGSVIQANLWMCAAGGLAHATTQA